jgi:hypothetical protein
MRARGILASVFWATLAAAGCAHTPEILAEARGKYALHDYDDALAGYREAAAQACTEGATPSCCEALSGEGDSLMGQGERMGAAKAFARAARDCPYDLTVRRKLYLAQTSLAADETGSRRTITLTLEHDVAKLGARVQIVWVAAFFDGQLVGREPLVTRAGRHDVEAEAFLRLSTGTRGGDGARAGELVRLTAHAELGIPARMPSSQLVGVVRLAFDDRGLVVAVPKFSSDETATAAPEADANAAGPDMSRAAAKGLLLSGEDPRIPTNLRRPGAHWRSHIRVCVEPGGHVTTLRFLELPAPAEPRIDAAIVEALRRWRHRPYTAEGKTANFCYDDLLNLAVQ